MSKLQQAKGGTFFETRCKDSVVRGFMETCGDLLYQTRLTGLILFVSSSKQWQSTCGKKTYLCHISPVSTSLRCSLPQMVHLVLQVESVSVCDVGILLLHCKRCTSYGNSIRLSVHPTVCHTPVLCQNDST